MRNGHVEGHRGGFEAAHARKAILTRTAKEWGGEVMTRDEIIAMAREAWGDGWFPALHTFTDELARFAALVSAKEREACAQVCEGFKQGNSATYIDDDWADMCAEAIRARGTKEGA